MITPRVIPCLLLRNRGLVKTVRFRKPTYLGDPINVVKIFNEKEVDELIFLDITATTEKRRPPFALLERVAGEAFMPLGYGGGIRSLEDAKTVLGLGFEKIIVNTYAIENPGFIRQAADILGSQSVIVSIDVKRNVWGRYRVFTCSGKKRTPLDPVSCALEAERAGAGEILLNSMDRDGTMGGYDLGLITAVTSVVRIPLVACGGAGSNQDLAAAVRDGGASAVAAGSLFVYQGPHRAVLINYPDHDDLRAAFGL